MKYIDVMQKYGVFFLDISEEWGSFWGGWFYLRPFCWVSLIAKNGWYVGWSA